KCFYRNGKKILKKKDGSFSIKSGIEKVNSLVTPVENFSIASAIDSKNKKTSKNSIRSKIINKIHLKDMRAKVTYLWASLSVVTIFTFLVSLMLTPQKAKPQDTKRYAMYASRPLTLHASTISIYSKDSRAQKINEVYKKYNCPLEGLGDVMVFEADKNDIPWWLLTAVSFQESGCGKRSPKVAGAESYNAWGWGVYGGKVFTFDNWVRGIETISKYFSDKFYSKGIDDTCVIMKTYTPPSDGSWCNGVNHFSEMIQNYETPEI
ncbi:hypothetical protein K0B04_04450, partial [Patescibacteria group bacterium]|nr:hypothetical protein [Patescibacteria group bacterium]